MEFNAQYEKWLKKINVNLEEQLAFDKNSLQRTVYEAMYYSLNAGGKRIRPVLAMAICDLLDGDEEEVLPFACSIEMIHTYSLIHDDLPAMDNDDFRRGRATNHKIFGEAMAILAGDGLLNLAFESMLRHTLGDRKNLEAKITAMDIISRASGVGGMIGGQVVDMESEGKQISPEVLQSMHRLKTGALLKAPVMASAVLCGADQATAKKLEIYADSIGLAFQVQDDILDIIGDPSKLGKKPRSDSARQKSTFITVYGMEESKKMLQDLTDRAKRSIADLGAGSEFLLRMADFLINRKH